MSGRDQGRDPGRDPGRDSGRVYVGDLGSGGSKPELEREFERYGPLKSVWVARNPPGKWQNGRKSTQGLCFTLCLSSSTFLPHRICLY